MVAAIVAAFFILQYTDWLDHHNAGLYALIISLVMIPGVLVCCVAMLITRQEQVLEKEAAEEAEYAKYDDMGNRIDIVQTPANVEPITDEEGLRSELKEVV